MTAKQSTQALSRDVYQRTGISLSYDAANTLRRAQLALRLWHEAECNGGIWRSEDDGLPYDTRRVKWAQGIGHRIPDREASAIRRVADVCRRNGLAYYQQTDPRGCTLYVAKADAGMTEYNYSSAGVPCCTD